VKNYVTSADGKLELFYLPGYSPELNPDEWAWKNVKHDLINKAGVASKDDLKARPSARSAACRKRRAWSGLSSPIPTCAISPPQPE
jgi:transposase